MQKYGSPEPLDNVDPADQADLEQVQKLGSAQAEGEASVDAPSAEELLKEGSDDGSHQSNEW